MSLKALLGKLEPASHEGYVRFDKKHRIALPLRLALTALGLFGSLVVVLGSTAQAAQSTRVIHSTTIKPDYAFYRGKTITFIVPNTVGSYQDQLLRGLIPSVEATLGATINEEIIPGSAIIGSDEIGASPPDGLTIGTQNVGSQLYNIYTNASPESFSLQKEEYFVAGYSAAAMWVSCAGSPITSMNQILHATKPITVLDLNSASDEISHTFFSAYHIPVQYISGYTGATLDVACLRGDGEIASNTPANIANAAGTGLPPGEKLLMTNSKIPIGTFSWVNTEAPTTLTKFVTQHPPKTRSGKEAIKILLNLNPLIGTAFFAPQYTAKSKVLALEEAFKKAWFTPAALEVFHREGVSQKYTDPHIILPSIKFAVDHITAIRKYLAG